MRQVQAVDSLVYVSDIHYWRFINVRDHKDIRSRRVLAVDGAEMSFRDDCIHANTRLVTAIQPNESRIGSHRGHYFGPHHDSAKYSLCCISQFDSPGIVVPSLCPVVLCTALRLYSLTHIAHKKLR